MPVGETRFHISGNESARNIDARYDAVIQSVIGNVNPFHESTALGAP